MSNQAQEDAPFNFACGMGQRLLRRGSRGEEIENKETRARYPLSFRLRHGTRAAPQRERNQENRESEERVSRSETSRQNPKTTTRTSNTGTSEPEPSSQRVTHRFHGSVPPQGTSLPGSFNHNIFFICTSRIQGCDARKKKSSENLTAIVMRLFTKP